MAKDFKPWTQQDEQDLRDSYESGSGIVDIARDMGKTPLSVIARLARLGSIYPHQAVAMSKQFTRQ